MTLSRIAWMSREKTLIKNTAIISIGKICTSAITFLLLPLYTGILSTKEYGIVDLLNTLLSLLVPIITLQLEKAVFRELIDNRSDLDQQKKIISTGIIATLLQCVLFILVFNVFGVFYSNEYSLYLELNIIAFIFLSLFQQIARGQGRISQYAVSNFISASLTIVLNILFLTIFKMGIYGMLLGTIISYIISALYLIIRLNIIHTLRKQSFSRKLLKSFLKFSIPLVPNSFAWWIFSASDRVIISSFLGLDQNGIVAASLKFSTIVVTLYSVFNYSWIESIASNINDRDIDKFFNKIFNAVIILFTSIILIMTSFMPIIYPIMINENYSSGYWLIPITMVSALFNVTQGMVAVVFEAKRNTKFLSKTSVISAIINVIVHILLIRYIGIYASVISTLVALITMTIYRIIKINNNYFKVCFDKKNVILTSIFVLIIILLYYMNNLYTNALSMCTAIAFTLSTNFRYLDIIKELIAKKIRKSPPQILKRNNQR